MNKIILVILLVLALFTYAVFNAASSYQKLPPGEGWEPPTIPLCEKPLWERITEGCE